MVRVVGQACPTLGAQAGTVVPAQRLERQCKHHRVPQQRLQVAQFGAGEIGHITVLADGRNCGCGNRGCLEQYASATAVVRMAKEAIAELNDLVRGLHPAVLTDRGLAPALQSLASRSPFPVAITGVPTASDSISGRVSRVRPQLAGPVSPSYDQWLPG